jgi:L-ribulose-5-phosphate 3-epimerase
MLPSNSINRRTFVRTTAALAAAHSLITPSIFGLSNAYGEDLSASRTIYKTLKIGMVRVEGSLVDKFKAAKQAGFHGIEMNAPGMNVAETKAAIAETGLPVDGTVCSSHWNTRHTSADAKTRATALEHLKTALRDTKAVGGNTVLLVVGKGEDGPENEIWDRSVANIAQALPLAAELGIYIAIENVWNQFCYDHGGDSSQTAEKYVRYVDAFNSPWVGMQFDIGNHWKYGDMGQWIRTLGKRVVKLDVKGFSRAEGKFTKITEGDVDWVGVQKALKEIGYTGWAAAEVTGGDLTRLQEVSKNMDKALGLS